MVLLNIVNGRKLVLSIMLTVIIFFSSGNLVLCQNCGCKPGMCCNQYGYCGRGSDYCGRGCQSGWCKSNRDPVADIVTDGVFNRFKYHLNESCTRMEFYTRELFFDAIESYPEFGMVGMRNDSRREIAAFFAHFTHDIRDMCRVMLLDVLDFCDRDNKGYPCNPGDPPPWTRLLPQQNHGLTSQNINIDYGLNQNNLNSSFEITLKFWMKNCHDVVVSGQGFGETIRAIDGKFECDGANPDRVSARVQYYKEYSTLLRVHPGTNLRC